MTLMQGSAPPELGQAFVKVSRSTLFSVFAGVFGLAGILIFFCITTDLELLFSSDRIALKIGATVIRMDQFYLLKSLSGAEAEPLSESAYARRLTEMILLAETARTMKLDQTETYKNHVRIFDQAMAPASDPQDLTRALFLIGELAQMTRENLDQDQDTEAAFPAPQPSSSQEPPLFDSDGLPLAGFSSEPPPPQPSPSPSNSSTPQTLHLRTILVTSPASVSQVLNKMAFSVPFSTLNAEFSQSPYVGVGGDLGWVKPGDLPEGVFQRLSQTPVGSLTIGFTDEAGTHFFLIEARPEERREAPGKAIAAQKKRQEQSRRLNALVTRQMQHVPVWVHPRLRAENKP